MIIQEKEVKQIGNLKINLGNNGLLTKRKIGEIKTAKKEICREK